MVLSSVRYVVSWSFLLSVGGAEVSKKAPNYRFRSSNDSTISVCHLTSIFLVLVNKRVSGQDG
jgi:hypothetical protein